MPNRNHKLWHRIHLVYLAPDKNSIRVLEIQIFGRFIGVDWSLIRADLLHDKIY